MSKQTEYLNRFETAETPRSAKYWLKRAEECNAVKKAVKWYQKTTKKPKVDREYAKAYAKIVKLFGKEPESKKELAAMAYKSFHNRWITKRQARKLGCNIK